MGEADAGRCFGKNNGPALHQIYLKIINGEKMIFAEHVKIREEKFGAVIFETLKEKIFVTNKIGRDILALLQQGQPPEEIAARLAQSYAGQAQDIRNDVLSFIGLLKERALIRQ